MDLKEFVSSALVDIIEGVKDAREKGGKDAEGIASNLRVKIDKLPQGLMQDGNGAVYSVIDFDVAVTASSKTDGSVGIKVAVFSLGGSAGGEDVTSSRIKFTVPMRFNVY
ncbi:MULTISPECIES: hypothetical protein [unclassified Rhizobium]|uniref:hypothetical protein n=1 Tax=unclassified Rhizobium TaxID=2613769 RepID=UPI00177F25FF|nr:MULTISPECIES: hypothetical protein [unclassified Rhizobium]MBD8686610.1 hypothetical protein [Rhizobium sp. CFBP 13644]MBD8691588.1 hypothetical protein [Rhizobium sp. CFBP 13717]